MSPETISPVLWYNARYYALYHFMMNKLNNPFIIIALVIGGFYLGGTLNSSAYIKDLTGKVLSAQTTPTSTPYIEEAYIEPTEEPVLTEAPVIQKQVIYVYPTVIPTQPVQQVQIVQQQAQQPSYGGFPTKGAYCDHTAQEAANKLGSQQQTQSEQSTGQVTFQYNWESTYDSMFNECMRLMQ